jgi:protein ImuA
MSANPTLDQLRHRIHCLEETRRGLSRVIPVADPVDRRLPQGGLSTGCIHEVKGASLTPAIAFASILSARIAGDQGNVLYFAPDRSLHPPGLLPYGVKLNQVLHVSARRPQDLAWAVMEALRCSQVSSVIAVLDGLDLTESRRLQLAAEASGATGFFLGNAASAPVASPVTRWKVAPIIDKSGRRFDEPVWAIDLLYCRGGQPGKWILEWRGQRLNPLPFAAPAEQVVRRTLAG